MRMHSMCVHVFDTIVPYTHVDCTRDGYIAKVRCRSTRLQIGMPLSQHKLHMDNIQRDWNYWLLDNKQLRLRFEERASSKIRDSTCVKTSIIE